jgi:hypothetical protein
MTPFLGTINGYANGTFTYPSRTTTSSTANGTANTLLDGTQAALKHLLDRVSAQLPPECLPHVARTHFSTANTGSPYFPSPLKQTEAISALKAVEAGLAASIANLANTPVHNRQIDVDLERASAFLFSTYLATVDGLDKANPKVKKYLKGNPFTNHLPQPIETNLSRHRPPSGTVDSVP